MEPTSTMPSALQLVRSISLPTRIHPSSQRVQALLNHLKPSQERSISSNLEAETIQIHLFVLAELYSCMEELLQSSQTQQALLKYQQGKMVEEALCGSVTLLDACGAARELLLGLREHLQTLQSALRRRQGDSTVEGSISAYASFRKKAKKEIAKQLGALKRMEIKVRPFFVMGQDQNLICLARVLKEASTVTISVLRSLLLFLSTPRLKTKGSSLISKLKPTRLFSSEKEPTEANVAALCSLVGKGRNSEAQRVLEALIATMSGIEGGLDCTYRRLVKHRVCFLNMPSH
ncbi:uncharacterized protein LOC129321816 [Prosopis cineraria]|uniref:uncharacterized protein LOC129321816 n=1 Tax=Prosopis cineraria TaxID=364024 RepID=UPI00240F8D2C|nr:uncharacterized protein LOC129321816 [Prosopis cineraria]